MILECLICTLISLSIYAVEGAFTTYSSGVEGVSVFRGIVNGDIATFLGRLIYGYILIQALALGLCRALNEPLHWLIIGVINAIAFLTGCAFWELHFQFLHRLTHFSSPVYGNFVHIMIVACLLSPKLLLILHVPGSVLPKIANPELRSASQE